MKQIFTNPLRAFMLAVSFLFVLSLSAVVVEIDGINYELIAKAKQATLKSISSGYTGAVVIPESIEYEGVAYAVTSIGKNAFWYCYGLTSVTIPNSVTSIGSRAFCDCSGLTSVTIPNSVTSIEDDAFYRCFGLKEVHISDIAAWCNIDFNALSNPLSEAGHLYLNGEEVKDLVIPVSVTAIKDYAFSGCSGLTSVTIPNSVTSIGNSAFPGCSGLTSVTIPNSVTSIGNYAFDGCSGLTSVTIPNSVTSIGDNAFDGCSGLTSVTIPNSVTSIGWHAFYGCSGLTSVTIPNSVTSIGWYAFDGCSGLTSVTIGNSVKSIGEKAFAECSDLTDVYCYAEEVPYTDSYAFEGSYVEYSTLHVPAGAMEKYNVADPWSGFGKIVVLTEQETGIEELEAENANNNDAPVYNLNGVRMQNADNLPKGIYIKGGKKFVVK